MSWHSRHGDTASEIVFDPAGLDPPMVSKAAPAEPPRAGVPTMDLLERRDPRKGLRLEKEVGWGGLVFVAVILAALLTLLVWGLFT